MSFLGRYADLRLADGRRRVVRDGYLPRRELRTGLGGIEVQAPRARDREAGGIKFSSAILPLYLRRSRSIEELLPWLYLKGVSTNEFNKALQALLGPEAGGLSPSTIARLKAEWEEEYRAWRKSDLSNKRYVYLWADGIYCGIRGEEERLCMLVIIGVRADGVKELVALEDGYRESTESWETVLRSLKERGLKQGPLLGIGDGALGFWKALRKVFPGAKEQRCWRHKLVNVLDKFPKSMRGQVLEALREIWQAPSLKDAQKAWNRFVGMYKAKYPKAVEALEKDKVGLLTFFEFPAEHWRSIRTTNPIESTFVTVRRRTSRVRGGVTRGTMPALVYKLVQAATKNWKKLYGSQRLGEAVRGVRFVDGKSKVAKRSIVEEERRL